MVIKLVSLLTLFAAASAGIISAGHITYASPEIETKSVDSSSLASGYDGEAELAHQEGPYSKQIAYAQPAHTYVPAVALVKAQPEANKQSEDFDPHPQYKFGYDVQDSLSGDSKRQVEIRDGDVVRGEYSLIDADGFKRTVQYTADSVHGFNAIVIREPIKDIRPGSTAAVVKPDPVAYATAPSQLSYPVRSAQSANDFEPVVKGAYAVTPIVKAVPVAYPVSKEHSESR